MPDTDTIENTTTGRDLFDRLFSDPCTYNWHGERLDGGNVWTPLPMPEPGDTVTYGTFGMRASDTGELPEFFEVPTTAGGDYSGNTMNWSNRRSLLRDFPDYFIEVESSHDTSFLIVGFDTVLPEHLAECIVTLAHDYPVYDDEDYCTYEEELADAAWDQYLSMDVTSDLGKLLGTRMPWSFDVDQWRDLFYEITMQMPESPRGEGYCATSVTFPYFEDTIARMAKIVGKRGARRNYLRRR